MRNPRHCADAWNHPRLRGEYRELQVSGCPIAGSPPLARGIRISSFQFGMMSRITPACAGNTGFMLYQLLFVGDHPRLRGEYYSQRTERQRQQGSPPLARGIPWDDNVSVASSGITPACAGNTTDCVNCDAVRGDHPRLRGEYLSVYENMLEERGSPPLARGILRGSAPISR